MYFFIRVKVCNAYSYQRRQNFRETQQCPLRCDMSWALLGHVSNLDIIMPFHGEEGGRVCRKVKRGLGPEVGMTRPNRDMIENSRLFGIRNY
jgi:hypothetical protein